MHHFGTMHARCIDNAGDDSFVWTAKGWMCSECGRFMGENLEEQKRRLAMDPCEACDSTGWVETDGGYEACRKCGRLTG